MGNTPEYLDANKWAAMLGLVPSSEPSLQIGNETERELVFDRRFYQKTRIHQDLGPDAESLQWALWAEFTAKYLPLLVNRILDLPPHGVRPEGAECYPIRNIYHTTFKFTHIGYIAKFMSSNHTVAKGVLQLTWF
jgi:hypothetical protein